MKRITKSVVAVSVAAAVVVGGAGSFALWSESADLAGGSISAGTLAVASTGTSWTDISPDRVAGAKPINLASFSAVPGDTLEGTYTVDADLTGDNMTAEVRVNSAALSGALAAGMTATYDLYVAGTLVVDDQPLGSSASSTYVTAADLAAGGTEDVKVVVTAAFSKDATDLQGATANLSGIGVNLTQVRSATPDWK